MATWTWFHRFGSPPWVYAFAQRWTPWFGGAAALAMLVALYGGLVLAPADYQQKDAFRMVYVHAPTAWLSSKDMPAMRESYLTEAGTIEMLYEVDATGRVAACSIYKGTGDVDLDNLACSALLLRGRFEPATYKGAAVPSLGVLRYRFVVR